MSLMKKKDIPLFMPEIKFFDPSRVRFIPYDVDLANRVYKNFKNVCVDIWGYDSGWNCAGETLVQKFCGAEINEEPKGPDLGFDMVVDNVTIDIKTKICDCKDFRRNDLWFSVADHLIKPQVYWFATMDPVNKEIALQGWLSAEEVVNSCRYYTKGQIPEGCARACNRNFYQVDVADLHPITNAYPGDFLRNRSRYHF